MCDCYGHKCEKCDELLDMHLGDFVTSRDEIRVYCGKHLPPKGTPGALWKINEGGKTRSRWVKMHIEPLTADASDRIRSEENCPNTFGGELVSITKLPVWG